MKKILPYILPFCFFVATSFAQEKANEHLYLFNGKMFNLLTLQYEQNTEELASTFKSSSKYAVRYKGLAVDKLAYKGMLFESIDATGLLLKNLETRAATPIPNPEKEMALQGQCFLLECITGVIHIKPLQENNGYMIYKYDEQGKKSFGIQLQHSEFVQHGEYTYHLPYLGYKTHTGSSIVFSSYVDRIPKTVVVNALDGSLSTFGFSSIGIIRDPAMDMDVHGFIQSNKDKSALIINYVSSNFSIERPYFADATHAETLIFENTLVIASYNGRSPDVHLLAVDIVTEKVLWEADLAKLGGVANSSYFNAIWLGAYDDKIILEGYESKGKHLQIINSKTGKVLWKSF